MGIGRRYGDCVVAEVAVGRYAGDDASMGIDAETGRQRSREGQSVAGRVGHEVAGDIEREGFAFVAALVCDRGCGRAAVADLQEKALADRLAVGVSRRHRDRVVADVAVGGHAGDDAGMGIDVETCGQRSREGQSIAGGGRHEVAGNVEQEGLAFMGTLVCDHGCGRATGHCRRPEAVSSRRLSRKA